MIRITSQNNENYKLFARLYKKKYRDRTGCYVIEGVNLIEEAVKSGVPLRGIFMREDFPGAGPADGGGFYLNGIDKYREDNMTCGGRRSAQNMPETYIMTGELFDRAADTETPQGVAAIVAKPDMNGRDASAGGNIVVLDRLQDPGNIGTIIRTADAAGFGGIVVMKGTADVFAPKTVRAAAGSLFRVRFFFAEEPAEAMELISRSGLRAVCASPRGGGIYYEEELADNIALVIGNEAGGVCREFSESADISVTLPMEGRIESLNAAVSAAVIMYESVRQRRSADGRH